MGFFNDIGKKTSETTNKIAKQTKLTIKMNENKGKIKNLYEEIGKKVYETHVEKGKIAFSGELLEQCKTIDELANEIHEAKSEILTLNQKKLCNKCNQEIEISAQFCPKCGEKQVVSKEAIGVETIEKSVYKE